MNTLKAGFARVDITPPLGIHIQGYFVERIADGVLDPLSANALALSAGGKTAVLIAVDHCGIIRFYLDRYRKAVADAAQLPMEAVYISATHTHTGPVLAPGAGQTFRPGLSFTGTDRPDAATDPGMALEREYDRFLEKRLRDAALLAIADLRPARMGIGMGEAPGIAFVRRYIMKDGSVRTNPGVGNPLIDRPAGITDIRVNVLRFMRADDDNIVLVNFGCHPDVVGGTKISADWPGFLRRTVEKAIDGTKCLFFNGAQGDVNHVNVFPKGGDMNDMFLDFDDVSRGYGHARYMGRVVAAGVLQAYDKVEWTDVDRIAYAVREIRVASQMPSAQDDIGIEEARRIAALHAEGRDAELPYEGMLLTTMVAQAQRILRLEHGPAEYEMPLSVVTVGPAAFVGIPGEPFTGVGLGLKEAPGWKMILPTINTNAKEGYFAMMDSYDEGGYEARSSNYRAGVGETLIAEGRKMLDALLTEDA